MNSNQFQNLIKFAEHHFPPFSGWLAENKNPTMLKTWEEFLSPLELTDCTEAVKQLASGEKKAPFHWHELPAAIRSTAKSISADRRQRDHQLREDASERAQETKSDKPHPGFSAALRDLAATRKRRKELSKKEYEKESMAIIEKHLNVVDDKPGGQKRTTCPHCDNFGIVSVYTNETIRSVLEGSGGSKATAGCACSCWAGQRYRETDWHGTSRRHRGVVQNPVYDLDHHCKEGLDIEHWDLHRTAVADSFDDFANAKI